MPPATAESRRHAAKIPGQSREIVTTSALSMRKAAGWTVRNAINRFSPEMKTVSAYTLTGMPLLR